MEYHGKAEIRTVRKDQYEDAEMMPYRRLASAIALQTIRDYRRLAKYMSYRQLTPMEEKELKEIEDYFLKGWFDQTTGLNGETCLEKLKKERWNSESGKRCRYSDSNIYRGK